MLLFSSWLEKSKSGYWGRMAINPVSVLFLQTMSVCRSLSPVCVLYMCVAFSSRHILQYSLSLLTSSCLPNNAYLSIIHLLAIILLLYIFQKKIVKFEISYIILQSYLYSFFFRGNFYTEIVLIYTHTFI